MSLRCVVCLLFLNEVQYHLRVPKVIANVRSKLLDSAISMLVAGRVPINMRELAAEVQVAVGTVYNHFPTRRDLLVAVFLREWRDTLARLRDVLSRTPQNDERAARFAGALYKEIERRRGYIIAHSAAFEGLKEAHGGLCDSAPFATVIDELAGLLVEYFSAREATRRRDAATLIATARHLAHVYPHEGDANAAYLADLVRMMTNAPRPLSTR